MFSPVLAQDTLAALLREVFDNHAVGLDIHRFHYLDDVLILSRDKECMDSVGPQLGAFVTAKGLRISTKSCLKSHQNVLWRSKHQCWFCVCVCMSCGCQEVRGESG